MGGNKICCKWKQKICIIMSVVLCCTLFGGLHFSKKVISATNNTAPLSATVTTDTGINLSYLGVAGVIPSSDLWLTFNRGTMKTGELSGIKLTENILGSTGKDFPVAVTTTTGTDTVSGQAYSRFVINPNSALDGDANYTLVIPAGVFSDSSGSYFSGGVYNFKTAVSSTSAMNIYSVLPWAIKRKYPAGTTFTVYGSNFTSDCKVSIINESKGTVVGETYVRTTVVNSNTIYATLLLDGSSDTNAMKTVGKYGVHISSTGRAAGETDFSNAAQIINITELDKPQVTDINIYKPYPIDQQTIETMYLNGAVLTCLRISLYAPYLKISSEADLSSIMIKKVGGYEDNYVDVDKINALANITDDTLRKIEYSRLYNPYTRQITIPMKTLDSGYEYEITVPKNIVLNDTVTNDTDFKFRFKVMSVPEISEVTLASTVEGYSAGTMIRLKGANFYTGSVIEFNKSGKLFYAYPDWSKLPASQDIYRDDMVAFLPQGTTLEPGNYRVTVINDAHHKSTELQTFSVVKKEVDTKNITTNTGSIIRNGSNVIFEPSQGYLSLNMEKDLGSADTWTISTTYSSSWKFNNSRFYGDDFDLKLTSLNNKSVYTDYQTMDLSLLDGGKAAPAGKKLASKILRIILNNKASIKGHIDLRYNGLYDASMGLYYWNNSANKWIKFSKAKVNKANRTMGSDFDGTTQKSNIYFAIFK